MTWLLPTLAILPAGGKVRSSGRFDRRTYDRAYYHAKRKWKMQLRRSPAAQAKRKAQRALLYYANIERERANARARYWRNREKYAAAARERKRRKAQG